MEQDRPRRIPRLIPPSRERRFNEPTLRRTQTARQHTVPRLYLANFAVRGVLRVHDLQENRSFSATLNNAGVQVGYYNMDMGGLVVSTEDWLADIEAKAAPILVRLVGYPDSLTLLTDEDEIHLSRYICAQRFRTPWFREMAREIDEQTIAQIKPMVRSYIHNTLPKKEARELWKYWERNKPPEWWLGQEKPRQDADATAYMLSEVQGFANMLQAMPWRIGLVDSAYPLYACDNPLAAYASPVLPLPPRVGPSFMDHTYFLPLSRQVLLTVEAYTPTKNCPPRGPRSCRNYSAWETSFARHIVSASTTRFVFGSDNPISRDRALEGVRRVSWNKTFDVMKLQGYKP